MTLIFSLVGGLAIALIIQLLFASLGVALGLTILDLSPQIQQPTQQSPIQKDPAEKSSSKFSLPITHLAGFGIALGITGLIAITAFVSTDFSAIVQPRRGIIFGVIYWATYWTILTWLSTTTIAGIIDALFGGAIAGAKQILTAFKKSPNSSEPDEDSILKGLAAELSQVVDSQQALPALLASQKEALVKEISDRTQLSTAQTETILTDITPTEPKTSPSSRVESASASSLISKIESTLDLPSWQQLSQRVINQIDFSDIEALAYQIPSLLQEKEQEESTQKQVLEKEKKPTVEHLAQASSIKGEAIATVSLPSLEASSNTTSEQRVQTAVSKEIQNKLVSYCRYTNIDLLTPESLAAKVETQLEEHAVELEHLKIDISAIEDILSRRQNLAEASKRELISVLEATEYRRKQPRQKNDLEEASAENEPAESYPQKIQQALEHSVQSIEWQEILAPSVHRTGNLVDQMKTQIAHYLQQQDKLAFHPVQMAKDLTHIVAHGLRSLPDPSDLPNLAELETLWEKSSWQQALEERKDLTVDEVQEILSWGEAAWKPVVKQSSQWLQGLQAQADQLLSLVDNTSLDTAREAIVEQIGLAKEALEEQATAMKIEIQTQAEAARRQGAIAAWWLFVALSLSGVAAGGAGWAAVLY